MVRLNLLTVLSIQFVSKVLADTELIAKQCRVLKTFIFQLLKVSDDGDFKMAMGRGYVPCCLKKKKSVHLLSEIYIPPPVYNFQVRIKNLPGARRN